MCKYEDDIIIRGWQEDGCSIIVPGSHITSQKYILLNVIHDTVNPF